MSTVLYLPFDEALTDTRPTDATGNLFDLAPPPGFQLPSVVSSLTGRGREFGSQYALIGRERKPNATRLTRDLTVRILLTYDLEAGADGDVGTLLSRGTGESAAERVL